MVIYSFVGDIMITVVAALIEKDGKILIAKRATGDKDVFGKWEFPGGKVEKNETEEHAIEREIKEEFEITIEAQEFLIHHICEYPTKTVDLRLYKCKYKDGIICLHDHFQFEWISKDQLLTFDLAPADIPLAHFVMK